jgi:hypothetical protein
MMARSSPRRCALEVAETPGLVLGFVMATKQNNPQAHVPSPSSSPQKILDFFCHRCFFIFAVHNIRFTLPSFGCSCPAFPILINSRWLVLVN